MHRIPHPKVNPNELNRKKMRLGNYDYNRSGIYYVTFCTYDRINYLGEIIDGEMHYSNQGSLAEAFFSILHVFNPKVEVLNYVIMPDHIHALISLSNDEADRSWFEHRHEVKADKNEQVHKDCLSSVIGLYKASVTRCCNRQHLEFQWQKGFYDHVVRNPDEQEALNRYINQNPANWEVERTLNPMGWPL